VDTAGRVERFQRKYANVKKPMVKKKGAEEKKDS
jgi:ribosomal protein L31